MAAPKLKAPHKKSFYKSESEYLDAVYRNNKEYIDSHTPEGIKKKTWPKAYFKAEVKRIKTIQNQSTNKKFTTNQAIKRAMNSLRFNPTMTKSDIKRINFESLLKKDKEIYKEFRNRTRTSKGTFTKFDYSKVKFEGYYDINHTNASVYIYDDDIVIIEFKSPDKGTGASTQIMSKIAFDLAEGKSIFFIKGPKKENEV